MNMFKPTAAKTPQEYIDLIEDPKRKAEIIKLHEMIQKTVPDLKPYILSGMIGYGSFHYKSKSGREGDWSVIALASQKNYISVYLCSTEGTQYMAEKHKDEFPKASVGKSCIRIKKLEDIDLDQLMKLLKKGADAPGFGD